MPRLKETLFQEEFRLYNEWCLDRDDPFAIQRLIKCLIKHSDSVRRKIFNECTDDHVIRDGAMEVMKSLSREGSTFRGEAKLSTWAEEILIRFYSRKVKEKINAKRFVSLDGEESLGNENRNVPQEDDPDDNLVLDQIEESLNDADRILFQKIRQGLSSKEIAQDLKQKPSTIRSRKARLIDMLQGKFGNPDVIPIAHNVQKRG